MAASVADGETRSRGLRPSHSSALLAGRGWWQEPPKPLKPPKPKPPKPPEPPEPPKPPEPPNPLNPKPETLNLNPKGLLTETALETKKPFSPKPRSLPPPPQFLKKKKT